MSSGSMSVHSLIDKFQYEAEAAAPKKPQKIPPPDKKPRSHKTPDFPAVERSGVWSILGPDVRSFPFTEDAFNNAVKLKIEQEKTKQAQTQLEIASKNLAILTLALNAHLPTHLIPQMCVNLNHLPDSDIEESLKRHSATSSQDFSQPPANYRFGGSAPASVQPPAAPAAPNAYNPGFARKPLSPAKIGAAAVANLSSPTLPYRFPPASATPRKPRIVSQHQRHFSMPAESYNRPRAPELARVDTSLNPPPPLSQQPSPQASPQHAHARSRSVSSTSMTNSSKMNSPIGVATSMQVKPSPAQPLAKKSAHTPSQESMTSFQHIIQFHHWKPESPGSFEAYQKNHKRHKSDNMSIDMGRTITEENETMPDDDDDDDDDMETSMTEEKAHTMRVRKGGKYPNILSN